MISSRHLSLLCAGLLGLLAGCQTNSSTSAVDDGRVTINFENPEDFTDFKDNLQGTEAGRKDMEALMRRIVEEEASARVGPGQSLSITFTDIDLAGDFLPTASSGYDIRTIKAVYPPRMTFRYRLTDAAGAVVKEGEAKLSDLSFQQNVNPIGRNEELFHDRSLFRDWVRRELR